MRTEEFTTGLILNEKAITEHDGDLWIEGFAADVALDDQDEYFDAKALEDAARDFMASGNTPLLYHHKPDMQMGEITVLEPRHRPDGRLGLWMKARVDKPAPSHPILADAYQKVARGTMKGLSVAGRFFGEQTPDGWRIGSAKFREVSVTPLPVNSGTLAAVAQKAFEADIDDTKPCTDCEERAAAEGALSGLKETVNAMKGLWDSIQQKSAPTAEQRKKFGMHPGGEFPIWHCGSGPGSVKSALHLAGHSKLPKTKVMAHIRGRASDLGCPIKDGDSHKD